MKQVVDNERPWLNRTRREVETQAKKMLAQRMEYANPTQVGVAVQVFHNLGTLADTVLTTVKGCSNIIQQQTQDALNPATLTEDESAFAYESGSQVLPLPFV